MNHPLDHPSPGGNENRSLDLAALRSRLAAADGPEFWRSLESISATPEFDQWLHREFPRGASEWADAPSRRQFLKLMAASFALAGVTACTRQPVERITPYVKQPEELIPGIPLSYATAMTLGGYATGLLVESNDGRPTKIEGNPEHPMSLGAANVFHQASVLELYDPDRTRSVLQAGEISTWEIFLADVLPRLTEQESKGGAGLRILTETVTSPTLAGQLAKLIERFPQAKWHQYEPWNRDSCRHSQTDQLQVDAHYNFARARVVVSLDGDFLFTHPASLRHARHFAQARRGLVEKRDTPSTGGHRLYLAEPTPSITGSMADVRLACGAGDIRPLAENLARLIAGESVVGVSTESHAWLSSAARDLTSNRGAGIVLAGEGQPAYVHDLAAAMNDALGNVGQTVAYRPCAEAQPVRQVLSIGELAADMRAGKVELLVMLGGNPVYNAPADLGFAEAMAQAKHCVQLALSYNETARFCHWHLPEAHFLESWGDARSFDGTATIVQPLIAPLYHGWTASELLAALLVESSATSAYDIVREHWQSQHGGNDFDKVWRRTLHDGLKKNPAPDGTKAVVLTLISENTAYVPTASYPMAAPAPVTSPDQVELVFKPDPSVWDGRFANNGWLQELPKPITKLTWDNAACISPRLAEKLDLANEDVVELTLDGRSIHAPVWVLPGQAENSVSLTLGYGRTSAGHVGSGQGANAYRLRTSETMGFAPGLQIKKVPGKKWKLATTQEHQKLEGRDVYRTVGLQKFREDAQTDKIEHEPARGETLYPPDHTYPGYAWGMAIDLHTCIGCNACVVACQSENNIPIVGKGEVIRGREMHWIRVDGYFGGSDLDRPAFYHQPVPCMHCENAPCEVVCPVEATVHSPEGLNEQVYNRCIGTRYCSNNCPYKVRRFNFLQWPDNTTLPFKLQRNPDVSVRSRGVMEKCTFCVQRINEAKISAEKEDRRLRDGEILTACQQTCPTEAIVFGDINDPNSRVSRLKAQPRNYGMLAELGTRPRTTYLQRITNPPEVKNA